MLGSKAQERQEVHCLRGEGQSGGHGREEAEEEEENQIQEEAGGCLETSRSVGASCLDTAGPKVGRFVLSSFRACKVRRVCVSSGGEEAADVAGPYSP